MKLKLRLDKLSLKWKVFAYLLLFASIILVLLWLFQIVFLESFYKAIKTRNIIKTADSVAENIDSDSLQTYIDNMSKDGSTYIRIVSDIGEDLYDTSELPASVLYGAQTDILLEYLSLAEKNGGTYTSITSSRDFNPDIKKPDNQDTTGNVPPNDNAFAHKINISQQYIIHIKTVTKSDDSTVMIFVSSVLTPVNTTVETLLIQLICITVIFVFLSLLLAFFMSMRISKPIAKINSSAKMLAKGNYDIAFEGKGYLEISELNDTLNYAAKELSKVEGLRRELIANISHDLRTPLTLITGYSEVMRDIPGENTPENIQIVIDESKRLSTLVNDVLDISKLQSGTQSLNSTNFNITDAVRTLLKRYEKLVEQQGYHIKFIAQDDVFVFADEVKISQVLYNLINNAVTYTGENKTVTVFQSIIDKKVKIEVIDTGDGIPSDLLPLIWDRYYKVDKTHKRSAVGTGLGLSIVKGILDLHKAKYGVISSVGQGSIFWFELSVNEEKLTVL